MWRWVVEAVTSTSTFIFHIDGVTGSNPVQATKTSLYGGAGRRRVAAKWLYFSNRMQWIE